MTNKGTVLFAGYIFFQLLRCHRRQLARSKGTKVVMVMAETVSLEHSHLDDHISYFTIITEVTVLAYYSLHFNTCWT